MNLPRLIHWLVQGRGAGRLILALGLAAAAMCSATVTWRLFQGPATEAFSVARNPESRLAGVPLNAD